MDPAAYTLIGTLSGVVITQIASFLLEEKRIRHRRTDEEKTYRRTVSKETQAKRQEAYSMFLAEFDYWYAARKEERTDHMLKAFYNVVIISSEDIVPTMQDLMTKAQDPKTDPDEMVKLKGSLIKKMRGELTKI